MRQMVDTRKPRANDRRTVLRDARAAKKTLGATAFAESMIPRHEEAVRMAQQFIASGEDAPELKAIAQSIIATQGEEAEIMKEWLSNA